MTKVLMLVCFVAALAAGVGGGLVLSRYKGLTPPGQHPAGADGGSLSDQLQLSAEQREEMRRIWEGARGRARSYHEEVDKLQKGRDKEMAALLNVEQKAKYEKIARDYAERFSSLIHEREAMFDDAVQQTRKLLNPSQRERYELILRNRVGSLAPPEREGFPSGS